jgi:hypothetical protein
MTLDGHDQKTTIFPTFNCFTDAMEFVEHVGLRLPEKVKDITLVHAICIASEGGREYAHGWVEDSDEKEAIFCGIYMDTKYYFAAPFENFFETFKVKESTRYSVSEAVKENLRTFNFGPWEDKYKALCANGERTVLGGGYMTNVRFIGRIPTTRNKGRKHDDSKTTIK